MSITVSRRGASPPKRRAGSLQGFILPPVVEIRTNLVPTASLCKVPTLQPLQDNLQLLFGGSIDTRSPAHLTFVERGPEHTEFACPVLERCTRFFHCSKTCVPPCALPGPAPVRPKTWEESGATRTFCRPSGILIIRSTRNFWNGLEASSTPGRSMSMKSTRYCAR